MEQVNISRYRALIEEDLFQRLEEINFFNNQLNNFRAIDSSDTETERVKAEKDKYRKSLVLILYAHFEGFFRYSFEVYAEALNNENIAIHKAVEPLAASSHSSEFEDYEDIVKYSGLDSDLFNREIKKLEKRIAFLSKVELKKSQPLKLHIGNYNDKKSVIYTASNLKSEIIDRILYAFGVHQDLGISKSDFGQLTGRITQLMIKRNVIAHGDNKAPEFRNGVSESEYNDFKNSFDKIVELIPIVITKAMNQKLYLKSEHRVNMG